MRTQAAQGAAEPVEGVAVPGAREHRPEEESQTVASAEPVEGVAVPGAREHRPEEEPQAVAEEQTNNTSNEGTSPPGRKEPSITPVTEKPVAIRRTISQYVVSVDDATGAIVKMEKLDEKTGEPREFTPAEYAAAYGFASYAAPYYAAYAASLYNPLSSPAVQACLKAMAGYARAFTA